MAQKNFTLNIFVVILIILFAVVFLNSNIFSPTGYVCAATCAFKDDFNDNSFDAASWSRTSSSTITEESQAIKGTSTGSYQTLQTVSTFTGRMEFGALIKKTSGVDSGWAKVTITDGVNFDLGQNGGQIYFDLDGKFGAHIKLGGQNTDYKFTSISYSTDTNYWIIIKRNLDGTLTFKIEDSNHGLIEEKTTTQTISTSTAMKFDPIEVAQNNAPTIGYVDEIYVDDYVTPVSTTSTPTTTPPTSSPSTSAPPTSSSTTTPPGSTSSSTTAPPTTSAGSTSSSSTTAMTGGTTTTTRTGASTTSSTTTTVQTSAGGSTTTTITELIDVSDNEAYATILEANKTIVELQSTKNISEAMKLYGQAVDAYNTGDYANAKTFALQAQSSITEFSLPAAQEIPILYVSIGGIVLLVAIVGIAFYLQKKAGMKISTAPPVNPTPKPPVAKAKS